MLRLSEQENTTTVSQDPLVRNQSLSVIHWGKNAFASLEFN